MANTEIRKTLQFVRFAETEVTAALRQPGLTQQQRDLLDELSEALRDLDNRLLLDDINTAGAELQAKAEEMARLNAETHVKLQALHRVAETIDTVAKAIDGLVKAVAILGKAGLI